jgi:hypothetical protein
MDLQSRKLSLIGYLVDIQDEKVIGDIESTIFESRKLSNRQNLKRFTEEEMVNRAEEANKDYLAGRIKSQDELETESKNW